MIQFFHKIPHNGMKQSWRLERELEPEILTVPALLQRRAEVSGSATAQWCLSASKIWTAISWEEYFSIAIHISNKLRSLGLYPGDRVGIMAPSSPHWDMIQMGVLLARGVVVGLDVHDREENLNSIAQRCGLVGLVLHDPMWLTRFGQDIRNQLAFVASLQPTKNPEIVALDCLVEGLKEDSSRNAEFQNDTKPDDPATIIFTSGTTGPPKGIQYTHRQLCLAVSSILNGFSDIGDNSRLVCWLPLSNLFQRIINICAIGCGAQTYYVEDPKSIMHYLRLIEPHLFIAIPRFYEKLYANMMKEFSQRPAWQRHFIGWALQTAEQHANALSSGAAPNLAQRARYMVADRLVLRHLRALMGPRLRYLVSGSAQMPRWLLDRLQAMGLPVLEAYGLSENIIPIAANRPDACRLGTVGRVMWGNELRLAQDGELWVRGPGVFDGYYGEESKTELLDAEGYLPTGDYAAIDADGFITLTGRKSEIFKTSTGRKIAPADIESSLRQVPYIEHAAVFGAGRPFLVAVLAIAGDTLQRQASEESVMHDCGALCERIRRDIALSLASLPRYQRPAGAVVTSQAFSIGGGDLTPNLKLRRANVGATYQEFVDELYSLLMNSDDAAVQVDRNGGRVVLCSL